MIPVIYQGQSECNVLFIEKQNISQDSDSLLLRKLFILSVYVKDV